MGLARAWFGMLVAVGATFVPAVRNAETLLPDHEQSTNHQDTK